MPVLLRNLLLQVFPRRLPRGAGQLVLIAVVAVSHDVVDPHAAVAVVVVVALPDRAKGIDRQLPVVAKVPAQRLHAAAIEVAAKDHAFLIRLAPRGDFIAGLIDDRLAVLVLELLAFVAEIEIQLALGPENEGVNSVVVLSAADATE